MFTTSQEAKEFLVSRIAAEAQHVGVPLSEIEEKMLYFSETGWTLPDIMEVSAVFERDYDTSEYVHKIEALIRSFRSNVRKNNQDEFEAWKEAVRILRQEDHYLLVLIGGGEELLDNFLGRFLKLGAIAFVIFIAAVLFFYGYVFLKR